MKCQAAFVPHQCEGEAYAVIMRHRRPDRHVCKAALHSIPLKSPMVIGYHRRKEWA